MKPQTKSSDTHKKLLVVVLLIGLFAVLAWQNFVPASGEGSSGFTEATPAVSQPTGPLTGAAALTAMNQRLPKIDLDQILAHDPFQFLPEPEAVDLDALAYSSTEASATSGDGTDPMSGDPPVETLQVSAILHGGSRPAVMIGQRLYYESDQLENGWRILAIHADRVTVERSDDAP